MKELRKIVSWLKQKSLYPVTPEVNSPHADKVIVDGKEKLLFATNNYLSLMNDPRVVQAAIVGLKKWGIGNGSARLLTGNLDIHGQLEKKIADFKLRPAALTFVSGYMANSGSIPALARVYDPSRFSLLRGILHRDENCVIFSDELNHASIIAGIKMSGVPKEIYKHVDVDDLEIRLKKYSRAIRKIIITDGVFSMDGDVSPLPTILSLAKKYGAYVYLDDAHATGILGKNGRGMEDYYDVEGQSDIIMGTFTKAFGGVGGFIVGDQNLIDYLRVSSDTFIFTAPIAPPVVYGLMKSIDIAMNEKWRREKVISNASYLRDKLKNLGADICNSTTQIIPVIIGSEKGALGASKMLFDEYDIFVPAARWPAVPRGRARLRMTVSCDHKKDQIDYLVESIKKIKKSLNF